MQELLLRWLAPKLVGTLTALSLACILSLAVGLYASDTGKPQAPACKFCASECQCKGKCACKSLVGIWHVSGEEAGKPYAGVVIVQEDEDAPGLVFVHYAVGMASAIGVGIRDGDRLAVTWTQRGSGHGGVTSYRLSADGKSAKGTWTPAPSDGKTRKETLRYLRPTSDPET